MKPISSLPSRIVARGAHSVRGARCVFAAFLGCVSIASVAAPPDESIVRSAGTIRYASGGVGDESLAQLTSISRDFNVKLVFALASGEYLSDVRVVIADAKGGTLLDTTADGPWLLAKLPAGKYRIAATLAGKEQQHEVSVGTTPLTTVDFRWTSP